MLLLCSGNVPARSTPRPGQAHRRPGPYEPRGTRSRPGQRSCRGIGCAVSRETNRGAAVVSQFVIAQVSECPGDTERGKLHCHGRRRRCLGSHDPRRNLTSGGRDGGSAKSVRNGWLQYQDGIGCPAAHGVGHYAPSSTCISSALSRTLVVRSAISSILGRSSRPNR